MLKLGDLWGEDCEKFMKTHGLRWREQVVGMFLAWQIVFPFCHLPLLTLTRRTPSLRNWKLTRKCIVADIGSCCECRTRWRFINIQSEFTFSCAADDATRILLHTYMLKKVSEERLKLFMVHERQRFSLEVFLRPVFRVLNRKKGEMKSYSIPPWNIFLTSWAPIT